jgi:hypothetical protein
MRAAPVATPSRSPSAIKAISLAVTLADLPGPFGTAFDATTFQAG